VVAVDSSDAPGELEELRAFLNSWWIPNDTRQPVDDLPTLAGDHGQWSRALPSVPLPTRSAVPSLRALRDELRANLGVSHPVALGGLIDSHRWRVALTHSDPAPAIRLVPQRRTAAASLLAIAVDAIAIGRWHRLRACPDCGWVFYDTSRNASRTWCSMTGAGGARACGSIAKTRAYRARQAAGASR
jgi:predicted RNA-binding Zn ribbon-like protein